MMQTIQARKGMFFLSCRYFCPRSFFFDRSICEQENKASDFPRAILTCCVQLDTRLRGTSPGNNFQFKVDWNPNFLKIGRKNFTQKIVQSVQLAPYRQTCVPGRKKKKPSVGKTLKAHTNHKKIPRDMLTWAFLRLCTSRTIFRWGYSSTAILTLERKLRL